MDSMELGLVASSLGLGELPEAVLTAENKALQERLAKVQIRLARARADKDTENDELDKLHSHVESVETASLEAKKFFRARSDELNGESNLEKIWSTQASRLRRDNDTSSKDLHASSQQVASLEESLETRSTVLELLEEEHETDLSRLEEWSRDADELGGHMAQILRWQRDDEAKVKDLMLRMEKTREKVAKQKCELDESSTGLKMAQLALDKTAEEFRRLHEERTAAVARWNDATKVVKQRDQQLQDIYKKINDAKSRVREKSVALNQETAFLANEIGNIKELESQIRDAETRSRRLAAEADAKERDLEEAESRLLLEERHTMKLGADVAAGRARLKELKALRGRLKTRVDLLQRTVEEAKEKRVRLESSTTTSEQKLAELEAILERETKRRDSMQWELDRLRERRFKREQELGAMREEEAAANVRLKGIRLEGQNLGSRIRAKKEEMGKREEVVVALDFRMTQLDREVKEMKGQTSKENRAELKRELDALKQDLHLKSSDKRNLDHLLHKMEADVRRTARDIERMQTEEQEIEKKLEEVMLVTETSKRHHAKKSEEMEALLLEEKLLMVNERKARDDLKAQADIAADLDKRRLDEEKEAADRMVEANAQMDAWKVREKHLREDLRFIRSEIRERREQRSKLETKYSVMSKSLGDAGGSHDEVSMKASMDTMPSHAYHLVRLAQEKAELKEEGEELKRRLRREEEELRGMRVAAAAFKNSNDKFRANAVAGGAKEVAEETEEIKQLKVKVKEKSDEVERIKNQIDALEADIKDREVTLSRTQQEVETLQMLHEERRDELSQVEREVVEQERRLSRAERSCAQMSRTLRISAESSSAGVGGGLASAEELERDMDLRAEKEAQRAALIRVKEVAMADQEFAAACKSQIDVLGLSTPVLSRMELQQVQHRASAANSRNSTANRRSASLPRRAAANASRNIHQINNNNSGDRSNLLYRNSRRRSTSGSSSTSSSSANRQSAASVLVMDLSQVPAPGVAGAARISARLPPVR